MKGINHLVLTGHDLDGMRAVYRSLGFTLAPRGEHPFGTSNTLVQFENNYLELLALTRPHDVPAERAGHFSFARFNQAYLARHEGFAMLVLDSDDADRDLRTWAAAGVQTFAPFRFSRSAMLPDGEEVTVGFSLAHCQPPNAPWLGWFACQHYRPSYFHQPRYRDHANRAFALQDVWISGPGALELSAFVATTVGAPAVRQDDRVVVETRHGKIVLATPEAFAAAFGVAPPHSADGPHLAAFTVLCKGLDRVPTGLSRVGERLVLPPGQASGAALAFAAA